MPAAAPLFVLGNAEAFAYLTSGAVTTTCEHPPLMPWQSCRCMGTETVVFDDSSHRVVAQWYRRRMLLATPGPDRRPEGGVHLTDLRVPWRRTIAAAGLEGVRLHERRYTVGAWGATGGLSLLIVGRRLGHRQVASTERYAHVADDPVRKAAERASGASAAALDGKVGEVVELRQVR